MVRLGYRIAYRLWRIYLQIDRRETHGAQVAVIHQGRILITKSSYRDSYSLPGGYLKSGETSADCAKRELMEEVGLDIMSCLLRPAFKATSQCNGHIGQDVIFEYRPDIEPEICIDNREIVFAGFVDMFTALQLPVDGLVRQYIIRYFSSIKTWPDSGVAS